MIAADVPWLVPVFGWPGPVISLVLCILGIVWRRPAVLVTAAVFVLPFSFYIGLHPGHAWAFLLPLLPLAGARALARGSARLAWLSVGLLATPLAWLAGRVSG
jgi:hypothetical protein